MPVQCFWTIVFSICRPAYTNTEPVSCCYYFAYQCLFPSPFVYWRKMMSVIRHHYDPLTCIYLRSPPFLCLPLPPLFASELLGFFKEVLFPRQKVWLFFWKKFPFLMCLTFVAFQSPSCLCVWDLQRHFNKSASSQLSQSTNVWC